MLIVVIVCLIGCIYFIKFDWKKYGLLYLVSAAAANLLCYVFTYVGFYSFPMNVLHGHLLIPYGLVSTVFPFGVLFGVRKSPETWVWKVPFYWAIVHIGVTGEVILKHTAIFEFKPEWDLWDSYTLWWLYFLLFELLGEKIVPPPLRKPIDSDSFRYGRWGWIIFHLIVIVSIFLAGVYAGVTIFN
ncbi:hypothetical protein L1999_16025 [Neobacillus drentensis]|uniref:CBO0543 family protein n=1 Tax=Neobacillus drentensis TaxID=220684 RepID=UPI001F16A9EA|nr:CBO0543 family protein [Neobacillus drentensis]ULT54658.1 hypothetical protein L1999_16025 [Neobacillus drentensis]